MTLQGDRNHLHWHRPSTSYQFSSLLAKVLSCLNQLAIHGIRFPSDAFVPGRSRLTISVGRRTPRKSEKSAFEVPVVTPQCEFAFPSHLPRAESPARRFRQGRRW